MAAEAVLAAESQSGYATVIASHSAANHALLLSDNCLDVAVYYSVCAARRCQAARICESLRQIALRSIQGLCKLACRGMPLAP